MQFNRKMERVYLVPFYNDFYFKLICNLTHEALHDKDNQITRTSLFWGLKL